MGATQEVRLLHQHVQVGEQHFAVAQVVLGSSVSGLGPSLTESESEQRAMNTAV